MDPLTRTALEDLRSQDRELQNRAYTAILAATDVPVDWAYDAWDGLVADLGHTDNHVRAIAAQALCNLAKSDPELRILRDLPALLSVTKDERFVTARHCLQALWKVGVAGARQQQALVQALTARYIECITEKNATLIRYDILVSLRNVYDAARDEGIRSKAQELIALEEDPKYRKKYAGAWRVN
jgi:hypothetical protein